MSTIKQCEEQSELISIVSNLRKENERLKKEIKGTAFESLNKLGWESKEGFLMRQKKYLVKDRNILRMALVAIDKENDKHFTMHQEYDENLFEFRDKLDEILDPVRKLIPLHIEKAGGER